jgi:hypothetical protein
MEGGAMRTKPYSDAAQDAACEKALAEADRKRAPQLAPASVVGAMTAAALIAAHDPSLGLDRSVCLRDVVEALRGPAGDDALTYVYTDVNHAAANFIEEHFGGDGR